MKPKEIKNENPEVVKLYICAKAGSTERCMTAGEFGGLCRHGSPHELGRCFAHCGALNDFVGCREC